MTKTIKVLLGITVVGAIGTVIYILTRDKKTEVETTKDTPDEGVTYEKIMKKLNIHYEPDENVGEIVEDLMDNAEDAIEDFVETAEVKVEEAKDKVEEVTKDVVNRISRELAKSNNYDIPPYEISHETYIQPMSDEWKKVSVFYDGEKFHGIYGEEYKPFVLGNDNVDNFISSDVKVMYIRNENLECDYAVYKGEDDGEN